MKATKLELLSALTDIDPKYLKEFHRFLKPEPKWRIIMKKSVHLTGKVIGAAAAAAIVLGLIFLPGLWQNNGITQAAAPTEEKPLRICFDLGAAHDEFEGGVSRQEQYVRTLIHDYCFYSGKTEDGEGMTEEKIQIEVIPSDENKAAERSAALQRLRTEIMSGGGPDVYVCACDGLGERFAVEGSRLFPYVEFAKEDGVFLPLDDLLEEFQYCDPERLTKVLLDAGKNQAGEQVLLPIRYTIPVLLYEQSDLEPVDQSGKTWDDVLYSDDPLLKEQARWAWPLWWIQEGSMRRDLHDSALPCLFPSILNAESRSLDFTEEDLFSLVQKNLPPLQSLLKEDSGLFHEANYFVRPGNDFGLYLNRTTSIDEGLTLLPMRNQSGGVTAMIHSYGAVNSNTAFPKEAASFLDFICRKGIQSDLMGSTGMNIFGGVSQSVVGMPVNEEAREPNDSNYSKATSDEWEKATRQIDTVHFPSAVDTIMNDMTLEIGVELRKSCDPEFEWNTVYPEHYANGTISEEKLREIVQKAYQKMVELVGEA